MTLKEIILLRNKKKYIENNNGVCVRDVVIQIQKIYFRIAGLFTPIYTFSRSKQFC